MTRREFLRATGWGAAIATLPPFASVRAAALSSENLMLTRSIPTSGEKLPVIGLGTWQTFDVGKTPADRAPLARVLSEFVALGGKLIDSSPMYGQSEEVVGALTEELSLREKLFVATKVWISGRLAGVKQMEDSERKLKVKAVDLMQVHNLVDVETQLATLREWKQAGRVRYLGVTHYTASQHEAVAKIVEAQPLDFIQINYSVSERAAETRLLPLAREKGVAVLVNRPFAGGDLLRRLNATPVPTWAGEIDCTTWSQLLLKFVISHSAVTCAIPATSKVEHLRDNMKAGVGRMPNEAMRAKIAAAALG